MSNLIYQSIDEFIIIKQLSQTYYSQVYLAKNNQKKVVLKKFNSRSLEDASKEFNLTKGITHKNILKTYEFRTTAIHYCKNQLPQTCIIIVMEYACNGQLFQIIEKCGAGIGLPQILARTIFRMLIQGLEILHKNSVSHLDIKLQNLLLDERFNLKLADFGFATQQTVLDNLYIGTQGYMAPEIQNSNSFHTRKADIFSCGVVLFLLNFAITPFDNTLPTDIYFMTLKNQKNRFWRYFDKTVSKQLKDLIQKMLKEDKNQRIKIAEIKQHAWYKGTTLSQDDYINLMTKIKKLTVQ